MQNIKIQNSKFKMQKAKNKIQNAKWKQEIIMQNVEYNLQNAKHKKYKMQIRHSLDFLTSSSSLPLSSLEIAETEGTVVLSQIPSLINRSLHIKTSAVIMIVMVMVMMMMKTMQMMIMAVIMMILMMMKIPFLKRSD